MKKPLAALAALVVAGTLAIPAPASAQSFSFGFHVGPRISFCDLRPWDCRPFRFHHPRARIKFDVGPFFSLRFSSPRFRSHVIRCKARFKSYDWHSDMFLGFDGDWHRCRL